jgi:hypothetical protein
MSVNLFIATVIHNFNKNTGRKIGKKTLSEEVRRNVEEVLSMNALIDEEEDKKEEVVKQEVDLDDLRGFNKVFRRAVEFMQESKSGETLEEMENKLDEFGIKLGNWIKLSIEGVKVQQKPDPLGIKQAFQMK